MKKLTTILSVLICLSLAIPGWTIERQKKAERSQPGEKPSASQTEKKSGSPVEIAPPKEEKSKATKEPEQKPQEKREEKPAAAETKKIKLPALERKLIEQVDRFVDKNGNGIDDRLEGSQKQPERPKPEEKEKKID